MASSSKFVLALTVLFLVSVMSSSSAGETAEKMKYCTCNKVVGVCDNGCKSRCAAAFPHKLLQYICDPSEEIIAESIRLVFHKNGKVMAIATTFSLLSSSLFFFVFDLSSVSFARDMLTKESLFPISSSITAEFVTKRPDIKENPTHLFILFFSFILSYFVISLFSMMAVVIVSADSYRDEYQKSSLKELCSRIIKSCTRPFLTAFYTTVFAVGYAFLVLYMASSRPVFRDLSNLSDAAVFSGAAYILYLYLSSVWILSLVVSVVEEDGGGIAALGKSAEMIKGRKLDGFLLNVVLNMIPLAVYLCWNIVIKSRKYDQILGVVLLIFSCLGRIFTFVAYTVLYFRTKELN